MSTLSSSPYGPKFHIQKIECKNHIIRNYVSKLTELKNNTKYMKKQRDILSPKMEKLRMAVNSSISFWTENKNHLFEERVLMLQKEIENGPKHTFGDHTFCNISEHSFCTEESVKKSGGWRTKSCPTVDG